MVNNLFIHETAIVSEDSIIGPETKIWHFSHVFGKSVVGKNCVLGQNVMVGPEVKVGSNCKIQNNVSLYKGLILEDNVFCGPSCVFTNVKTPRAFIDRSNEFSQTLIKKGCSIGANATIICGIELGEYSMIGAGALVTKNVRPYSLVIGSPAKHIGWISESGERLGPDLICKRTGEIYEKKNGNLYKK
ncbi:MAG: acyltransferase [Alphaproteobacteria bacterium]|nr:acyltransferase [Alphaproteobacteria bacterium]